MRVSSYTIGAPLSDGRFYVLMHGLTGAVDKVPHALGEFLVEQRGMSDATSAPPIASLGANDQEQLRQRGYLTTLTLEEERQLLIRVAATIHEMDLAESPTGFMFIPAYICNLRCPYCFQPHEMHAGRGRFGGILTREQVDQGFEIIDQFTGRGTLPRTLGLCSGTKPAKAPLGEASDIGLFGGEPLRAQTYEIVAYIVEQARRRGRRVSAITNGVELENFVPLLSPEGLRELQITLDGTAGLHDRRRVGPGFHKTFERIADNIDLALRHGVTVSLRMNVDATNAAEVRNLDAFCRARGWHDNPLFNANAAAVTPEGRHKELVTRTQLVQLTRALRLQVGPGFGSYERYAKDTLLNCVTANGGFPFSRIANCAAETGLLMFDPLGDVYSCWEEIGNPVRRVGTYGPDGILFEHAIAKEWLTRFPGAIEDCSRCPYALIHSSGCAMHARAISGTMFAAACESFKEYFPETLADAYEEFEAGLLGARVPAAAG